MKYMTEKCIKIGEVEGKNLMEFSVSKIKKWRRCHKAFEYKYVRGLRPKKKAVALRRGTWVHECLEQRDLGNPWIDKLKELKRNDYDPLFVEEKAELGDLPQEVLRMLRSYEKIYMEIDKEWEVIAVEQDFMIRVDSTPLVMTGKIDKIARNKQTGKVWVIEHKTMKNLPSEAFRITDVQTAIYDYILAKILIYLPGCEGLTSKDIGGVIFDYIRTKPPTIPEKLKNGSMSLRKNIDTDKYTYLWAVKQAGLNPADYEEFASNLPTEKFFLRIEMPKYAPVVKTLTREFLRSAMEAFNECEYDKEAMFTRSLDWSCDRPRCEYRDLCIAELNGSDVSFMIKTDFERSSDDDDSEEGPSDTE